MVDATVLRVTQPREPCAKFNAWMGHRQVTKLMAQTGYCGFYLAVSVPGSLTAGQRFTVQPGPRQVALMTLFRKAHR